VIEPPLQITLFVRTAQSLAAPINTPLYDKATTFFLLESLTPTRKKGLRGLGLLPKIALLRGGFDLKSFGRELVEGKKMIFQPFI
jgi:hypothetical protein